ncbi:MAG TPA: tetratricopeptide repeat protein [Syntrophales bacterium]|nr:tetratricopeptide repeat protein [Syntrophales bacterium]
MRRPIIRLKSELPLIACIFVISCTMPKIMVMDGPLSAEQHNDLGVIYEKKGDYETAEKEYAKAISNKSEWATPYFNMGNLLYRSGNYVDAASYYRNALDRSSDDFDVMNNLANAFMMQGKNEDALRLIEKAIRIDPKEEYQDTQRKIAEQISVAKKQLP